MESFSTEDAVICILCDVRSACGGEIGEKGSAKGKEIRKDGVEKAERIENRAVMDGVERRDGFRLPVDEKLSRSMSVVSSQFSPQELTEELSSNLHSVCLSSLL